jgi:hypothetical protein
MQLHVSRPSSPQVDPSAELASNESAQGDRQAGQGRSLRSSAPPTHCSTPTSKVAQSLPHQLAKANQFGHHLNHFQPYSTIGHGVSPKNNVSTTPTWPLQRYPDRSAKDNKPRVIERSPIQSSHQPVQFIFGWVLRKMVKRTMRTLFPRRK